MTTYRQIDEPQPTIVGPRPAEGEGGKVKIPQGLERLLTLAGISAEWRGKVLADPLGAAAEARIELSESERAILKATPRAALAAMADSFAKKHGGLAIGKLAAAAAAAALLLTGATACGTDPRTAGGARPDEPPPPPKEGLPAPTGIRPDVPEEAPAVLWMSSLEDALAQAKKDNRAVMAVFPAPPESLPPAYPNRGISLVEQSQNVCQSDSKEFRLAVRKANLLAVRVSKPVAPPEIMEQRKPTVEEMEAVKKFEAARSAYEAALKKYGLEEKKLPAVVWLAPDGSELSKVVQPDDEKVFIKLIGDVPPLLAKWITEQRRREESQPATDGIRPDHPVTKGSRPDVP